MTIANAHTAVLATFDNVSGFLNPPSAVAPRTMLPSARAAIPPMNRITIATTRFGSQSRNWLITSDTAGSPSMSKATSSTTMRTSHFTSVATIVAGSVPVPIFVMKSPSPDRCISSSNRIARSSPVTARASSDDTNQPIATMTMKPRIRGIAPRIISKASRNESPRLSANDSSSTCTGTV